MTWNQRNRSRKKRDVTCIENNEMNTDFLFWMLSGKNYKKKFTAGRYDQMNLGWPLRYSYSTELNAIHCIEVLGDRLFLGRHEQMFTHSR